MICFASENQRQWQVFVAEEMGPNFGELCDSAGKKHIAADSLLRAVSQLLAVSFPFSQQDTHRLKHAGDYLKQRHRAGIYWPTGTHPQTIVKVWIPGKDSKGRERDERKKNTAHMTIGMTIIAL